MISMREKIVSAVVANLEAIIGNPDFKRGEKLRSVQRYIHRRRGAVHTTNQKTEETILVRSTSQTTSYGESGNLLKELEVLCEWVLLGESVTEADLNEAEHDFDKALWTFSGDLFTSIRGCRSNDLIILPQDPEDTDGILYTLNFTYSTEIGDPTGKGL